jgi:antitoxin MazE
MNEFPVGEFRKKSQITIPKEIVKKYNLTEGDKLEFIPEKDGIKLRPVVTIPKSQLWYWSDRWQKNEKNADEDIKAGRVSGPYDSVEDLMKELEDNNG